MSETKNTGDKTLTVERKKTLSLRRGVEQGTVRQSFSHGRSKSVVVEKRKRRLVAPGQGEPAGEAAADKAERPAPAGRAQPGEPRARSGDGAAGASERSQPESRKATGETRARGQVHRTLTSAELDARAQALAGAKAREASERQRALEEAEKERLELERIRREREEAERHAAEEAKRAAEEAAAEEAGEPEAAEVAAAAAEPAAPEAPPAQKDKRAEPAAPPAARRKTAKELEEDEAERARAAKRTRAAPAKPAPRGDDRRRTKLTITTATEEDTERGRSLAAMRRRREKEKRAVATGPREKISREVVLPETITIQELAGRMAERGVDVIKLLMKQGQMHKITDVIDADTAELVASEMGHQVKRISEADVEEGIFDRPDDPDTMVPRPPVVTVMGHVDHGKTSLLDVLRKTNVVSGEAGGITQHIGAYQVELEGQKITFLDTPGHAAFTQMRARGARATDIVILVVAADDGVMPQTVEAISHARAAGVPLIVAINKIDKPGADPNRVRTDLLQHEIVVESMGGDVQEVEVSALKQINLDKLLEACLLQAELLELKANPDRPAEGVVVEAQLDRGRGPVATVLVQRGTLTVGDVLIVGAEWGRVRALIDDQGRQVKEATPSMPAEVLGLQGVPEAGDRFAVVENESRAREISEYRQRLKREKLAGAPSTAMSLEQMMSELKTSGRKEFPIVLKGDVQGSVEAITGALDKLGTEEVVARLLHSGVGGITESDVTLAAATGGIIIGFNVRANRQAREAAERAGVEIRYYSIIYNLVDDVKAAMSGLLAPERRETFLGNAEILEVFNISKVGKVAGCRVTEGAVERGASVRLLRDHVVIHEGRLATLKRFKDEVREVHAGQECGMAFENYQDIREGDVIECFRVEEIARTLA